MTAEKAFDSITIGGPDIRYSSEPAAHGSLAAVIRGRRGGKSAEIRRITENAARAGQHVHAVQSDGIWCVTLQPVGLLWARVQQGSSDAPDA